VADWREVRRWTGVWPLTRGSDWVFFWAFAVFHGGVAFGGFGLRRPQWFFFFFFGFYDLNDWVSKWFYDLHTHTAHGNLNLRFFFFLNRINLINGLVQTFGLK
jgi:hypothetical protein